MKADGIINYKVTSVTLDKNVLQLTTESGPVILTAMVAPYNSSNKSVTWSSSNPSVAEVDQDGMVTAVAAGEATITVTTADGSFTAACTATVFRPSSGSSEPSYSNTIEAGKSGAVEVSSVLRRPGMR